MQITIEDISPVEKRVEFEVPWRDVAPKLEQAYDKLRRDARLKGFRPGKVPRTIIEKMYKPQVEDDVARELIEQSLGQAITENQIHPVAPPTVDRLVLKSNEPFRFSARVEVRSQVQPKDYSGIALKRRPVKVSAEGITNALENYRRKLTQYMPVEGRTTTAASDVLLAEVHGRIGEHKVKKDTVMIDLADDNAGGVPGLSARLRDVPIGSQHLEIKYQVDPESSVKNLAGKDVSLHVAIKEARERKQPALDDEMAKDTGEADTLEGLKKVITDRLIEEDRQRIKQELGTTLIKQIVERNPFPVAPSLVDRYAESMVNRTKAQLRMAGVDLDQGEVPFDVSAMKQEVKAEAEAEARAGILLQAIAEREGVEVTDADIQKRIAELAAARQENAKKLRGELERNGRIQSLRAQLLHEKTLDMLLSQAKISDEDPERLIITPDEAGGRLVLTPEEAREEALRAEQLDKQVQEAEIQGSQPRRKKP